MKNNKNIEELYDNLRNKKVIFDDDTKMFLGVGDYKNSNDKALWVHLGNGEPVFFLTIDISKDPIGIDLKPDEIAVKLFCDLKRIPKALVDTGLFSDTGKGITSSKKFLLRILRINPPGDISKFLATKFIQILSDSDISIEEVIEEHAINKSDMTYEDAVALAQTQTPGNEYTSLIEKLSLIFHQLIMYNSDLVLEFLRKNTIAEPVVFEEIDNHAKQKYFDRASKLLDGFVYCTRDWTAWRYGTMREEDFVEAEEDDESLFKTAKILYDFDTNAKTDRPDEVKSVPTNYQGLWSKLAGKELRVLPYRHEVGLILVTGVSYYTENNRPAIYFTEKKSRDPYATLTVNIPHQPLEPDEFIVEDWGEARQFLINAALNSNWFIDTGKKVKTGYVEAPIWKLNPEGIK